jgi:hypothetical protein
VAGAFLLFAFKRKGVPIWDTAPKLPPPRRGPRRGPWG